MMYIITSEQGALDNTYVLLHTYAMSQIEVHGNGAANATS